MTLRPSKCYVTAFGLLLTTLASLQLFRYGVPFVPRWLRLNDRDIIDFSAANNVTGYSVNIVPNIVHYVHFGQPELSFVEAVSILSVNKNHNPYFIYIHCNCTEFSGKYWDKIREFSNVQVKYMDQPKTVFGKKISWIQHASDIARLKILMQYGGIYLDTDTYVVKSLDKYRKYEMALAWPTDGFLGSQVVIAHKDARFLRLWHDCYRDYRPDLWYFNAGELPTKRHLFPHPELVHRVPLDLYVQTDVRFLYAALSSEWQQYTAIHLLINHKGYLFPHDPVKVFDEENIKTYNRSFGDMVRLVWFGSADFVTELTP